MDFRKSIDDLAAPLRADPAYAVELLAKVRADPAELAILLRQMARAFEQDQRGSRDAKGKLQNK